MPNPQSIYVLDDLLYYADSRLKSIFSLNLTTNSSTLNNRTSSSSNSTLLKKINTSNLKEIFVFSDKSQVQDVESPCKSSQNVCEQLCFAMPGQNVPKCACAVGELDTQNGKTCKTPKEYLIYAMGKNKFLTINIPEKKDSQMEVSEMA